MGDRYGSSGPSPDKALSFAKILLDENTGESFIVQATPFVPTQELILAFVHLGCDIQTTKKPNVFTVCRNGSGRRYKKFMS